jgi:PEP-CTERM motif
LSEQEMAMKRNGKALMATLVMGIVACLSAAPAQAVYAINIVQSGPNVVATGSGSINLTGLRLLGSLVSTGGAFNPSSGFIAIGGLGSIDSYSDLTVAPVNFGLGTGATASVVTGSPVRINSLGFFVPGGYVSGTSLGTSTASWNNATFASLGLRPGSYLWTWGSGVSSDSFTLNITAPPVPEPTTWGLMLLGLGITGAALRRSIAVDRAQALA